MSLSSVTVADIAAFLGWCSLINLVIIALTTVAVLCFNTKVAGFYSCILKLEPKQTTKLFYRFLVHYEIAVLVLNIVPFLALKIMS